MLIAQKFTLHCTVATFANRHSKPVERVIFSSTEKLLRDIADPISVLRRSISFSVALRLRTRSSSSPAAFFATSLAASWATSAAKPSRKKLSMRRTSQPHRCLQSAPRPANWRRIVRHHSNCTPDRKISNETDPSPRRFAVLADQGQIRPRATRSPMTGRRSRRCSSICSSTRLRHHPPQALEDRRPGPRLGASRQGRHGLGLSGSTTCSPWPMPDYPPRPAEPPDRATPIAHHRGNIATLAHRPHRRALPLVLLCPPSTTPSTRAPASPEKTPV